MPTLCNTLLNTDPRCNALQSKQQHTATMSERFSSIDDGQREPVYRQKKKRT